MKMIKIPTSQIRDVVAENLAAVHTHHDRMYECVHVDPIREIAHAIAEGRHPGEIGGHRHVISSFGGRTIVFQEADNGFNVAWASCAMTDRYNKKLGRQMAVDRMRFRDSLFSLYVAKKHLLDLALAIMTERKDLQAFNTAFIRSLKFENLEPKLVSHLFAIVVRQAHEENEPHRRELYEATKDKRPKPPKRPSLRVRAKKLRPTNHPEWAKPRQ